MSVLKIFKNIPRSPYGGRQALNVIFFLQICNEVPGRKKRWLSHPQRATGGPRPQARQGGLSPLPRATAPPPRRGRLGHSPLYKVSPLIPSSFELKKSTKNPEKREG